MGGEVDMPVVCCMKTLRNLESVVDFLSKHQVDDREIVSASANEFEATVHLRPDCVRRLGLSDSLKSNSGSHYQGRVGGCHVSTIDERRFLVEQAGKVG